MNQVTPEEKNYRVFYDKVYRRDHFDFTKDIKAKNDEEAREKAKKFIKEKNNELKKITRSELIERGLTEAHNFSDEQLLTGNRFILTGVSILTKTTETVTQVKENLTPISID